jgi:hypothetical protein
LLFVKTSVLLFKKSPRFFMYPLSWNEQSCFIHDSLSPCDDVVHSLSDDGCSFHLLLSLILNHVLFLGSLYTTFTIFFLLSGLHCVNNNATVCT